MPHLFRQQQDVFRGYSGGLRPALDAYVRLAVDGMKGPRTKTVKRNLSPEWEEFLYSLLIGEVRRVQLLPRPAIKLD